MAWRRARRRFCSNAEKTVVTVRMVRCRASFGQREEAMLKRIFALALGLALGAPVLAADSISATHVFPASLIYSRSFLEFVKKANEAGKGEFAIQVRGGPEAIGMMEQPGAVRSGVVDMVYSPCAFYAAVRARVRRGKRQHRRRADGAQERRHRPP